ncbi:MAG: peptide/nickel transport system permease protein [Candidatus Binatota bacterium]|nr:peptide/nickel transport system permease protein [Candidatus Binatota bacterium]
MKRSQGYAALVWRQFRKNRRAIVSFYAVVALGLVAAFADVIANEKPYVAEIRGERYFPILREYAVWVGLASWPASLRDVDWHDVDRAQATFPPIPYSPERIDLAGESFAPPSPRHWLGTDQLGRDVAAGMVHGTRISLTIGLVVVAIQLGIGVVLGGLAGYYGGWVDIALSRLFEMMLSIPIFFLILTVAAVMPPSIYNVMIILGLTGWIEIARFVRSEFYRLRSLDFVQAARSLGVSNRQIMFRHILPNALAPVLVSASFGVASAVLAESALSFLGVGVPAELVTWGSILAVSRSNTFAWWLAVFPGLAIFVTVTAYNLLGDGLRDALDPRLRNR